MFVLMTYTGRKRGEERKEVERKRIEERRV